MDLKEPETMLSLGNMTFSVVYLADMFRSSVMNIYNCCLITKNNRNEKNIINFRQIIYKLKMFGSHTIYIICVKNKIIPRNGPIL